MTTMRTYGDGCAIAQALDLVGERWALLVVRELLLGPKRYTDLRGGLPNASPNVLSQRLGDLERAGVVRRRKLPPPAAARVYELTEWGRGLEPIVIALGQWAARSPSGLPTVAPVGVDSMILALRSRFQPESAPAPGTRYELTLGEDRFRIDLDGDKLEVVRGDADDADARITTDPDTLAAVLWDDRSFAAARRSGTLTVTGDRRAAERFMRLFPMPEAAAAA